jgi:hypothetical protein
MTRKADSDNALSLLYGTINGDATLEDGAKDLRAEGINSLEDVLSLLASGFEEHAAGNARVTEPLDFSHLRKPSPPDLVSKIVQRVPEVPFILNGITYDPQDITRFNGQELHFVTSPDAGHMLVLDSRDVLADWFQYTYLDRLLNPIIDSTTESFELLANPVSYFWDDTDLVEYAIAVNKNRGYRNLKDLDFFWPSGQTWNDRISSISMFGTGVAQIHEHVDYVGQSFTHILPNGTPSGGVRNLHTFGWGDRASAIGTW